MTPTPTPALVARVVKVFREAREPIAGADFMDRLRLGRLRTVGEVVRAARLRGIGITFLPGRGYVMAKSRAERIACAERMERAARRIFVAARALRRGRSRQTKIPATRQRAGQRGMGT